VALASAVFVYILGLERVFIKVAVACHMRIQLKDTTERVMSWVIKACIEILVTAA
jgi:hypothetical protein